LSQHWRLFACFSLRRPGFNFCPIMCGICVRQNGTGVRFFPPNTADFPCPNHSTSALCSFVRSLHVPWNLNNCQRVKGIHLRKRTKGPDYLWGPHKLILCKIKRPENEGDRPLSSTKIRNEWSCTSITTHIFMECTGTTLH